MKIYKNAVKSTCLALLTIAIAVFLTPRRNQPSARQLSATGSSSETTQEASQQTNNSSEQSSNVVIVQNMFSEAVLKSEKLVVVDFFATWCPMCKAMDPVFKTLSAKEEFKDQVKFVSLDIDQFQELAMAYGINAIPTFLFFKKGKVVGTQLGYVSSEKFDSLINDYL